jgi:hypothetical protein
MILCLACHRLSKSSLYFYGILRERAEEVKEDVHHRMDRLNQISGGVDYYAMYDLHLLVSHLPLVTLMLAMMNTIG